MPGLVGCANGNERFDGAQEFDCAQGQFAQATRQAGQFDFLRLSPKRGAVNLIEE